MIRLIANLSKKLPIPGEEFSSRSCSAGIEVEAAGENAADVVRRLEELYGMLEKAVDAQMAAASSGAPAAPAEASGAPAAGAAGNGGSGNNGGRGRRGRNAMASDAQVNAICAIARRKGLSEERLAEYLFRTHRVERPEELSIAAASKVIDALKELEVRS